MAKENAVAVAGKSTAVASATGFNSFEEFANEGLEAVSSADLSIPYLRILAQLSPQVNKRDGAYVQGAEAGMIYNTVENTVFNGEEGVNVIPCYYRRVLVEWKPREKGGGFVATYGIKDPVFDTTYRNDSGKDVLPNGNILETTAEFYVLLLTPDGGVRRCLITMTASQLKKARKWVTQIQTRTGIGEAGNIYVMPMMSGVFNLTTVEERNDKGSWFGWEVSFVETLDKENKEQLALFHMGREFKASIMAGEVKVKQDVGDAPRVGSSKHDDDIPF